jgi:GNAT superfamily N-acetyltransferase
MVCPDWQADDNSSRAGHRDQELGGGPVSRSAVSVRRVGADATAEELDSLASLWVGARSAFLSPELAGDAPTVAATLRDALLRDCVEVFMARVEQQDVGFVVISRGPLLPLLDDVCVSIDHLYVIEEARRLGVGHALLARVTARAEQLGASQIATSVPATPPRLPAADTRRAAILRQARVRSVRRTAGDERGDAATPAVVGGPSPARRDGAAPTFAAGSQPGGRHAGTHLGLRTSPAWPAEAMTCRRGALPWPRDSYP